MKTITFALVLALSGFYIWAQKAHNCSHAMLDSALSFLMKQEYSKAITETIRARNCSPDAIETWYFDLAILQTQILDYESYHIYGRSFVDSAQARIKILSEKLAFLSGSDSLRCLFYIANLTGGIGLVLGKQNNWLAAIRAALKSYSMLTEVIKRDSTFYSAYLGIGMFNYHLSKNIRWTPFYENREQQGIDGIRIALKAEPPYNFAAINSLCWIYIEQGKYSQIDSLIYWASREYPQNTLFLRINARRFLYEQNYDSALVLARELISRSAKRNPVNWNDMVSGYQILVSCYESLKVYDSTIVMAQKALSLDIPEQVLQTPPIKKNLIYISSVYDRLRNTKRFDSTR